MRRTCCAIATSNTPVTMAAALRCASPPPVIAIALSVRILRWVRKRRRRPCAAGCPVPVTARTSWMRASRKWAWPIPPAAAANPASIGCRNSPQRAESGVAIRSVLRLRHHAQVRLNFVPAARKQFPGVIVVDRGDDDDVLPLLPVHGSSDLELISQLQRIDHAQDLVEISPGAGRIVERQPHLLFRIDHEYAAHGEAIARIGMNHAVEIGDTQIRISDHRKLYLGALRLLDVALPCNVVIDRVDRQPDHLDAALFKFALELRGGAKLSGADRGIVLGMREQHAPGVSEPRVQVDFPNGGIRFEIRCDVSELQCHEWALRRSS